MTNIIVTGIPNCQYCDYLANVVRNLKVDFEKVDLTKDPEMLAKAKEGGNSMPACIFVGDARYVVSADTPAKPIPVAEWLKDQGVVL